MDLLMQDRIMYIEQKTGFNDNGPAWIGKVQFSKTGRTIYFNGKAFKSLSGTGIYANYYDLETGDEYWISGVKKNGQDRHSAGGGKIMIDRRIIDEYLTLVDFTTLDPKTFELTDIQPTDKKRFVEIENMKDE